MGGQGEKKGEREEGKRERGGAEREIMMADTPVYHFQTCTIPTSAYLHPLSSKGKERGEG